MGFQTKNAYFNDITSVVLQNICFKNEYKLEYEYIVKAIMMIDELMLQ